MPQARQELVFAIRLRVIACYGGQFCLVVAALNLVTLSVALLNGEQLVAVSYALIILGLFCLGIPFSRLRIEGPVQMNEAMTLVALVFLGVPLIMTIPLLLSGVPFSDALFETVSAATTTGLSTLPSIEAQSFIFRFSRAWMQWYGGLGIVVLSLAIVVRPGMAAMRLSNLESVDDLAGGTRAHARRVLAVYGCLTFAGVLVWILLGGKPLDGLLYVLAAVSTGGFAPTDGSFADLPGLRLAWVATLACLAGAVPLTLYSHVRRKRWRTFFNDIELRALIVAAVLATMVLGINLWLQGMSVQDLATHAPLMAVSAQTTAGFSSIAPANLDAGSKAILILSMAIGGSAGSTAGGFKILRLLVLAGLLYRCLRSMSVPPDAVVDQRLGRRRIDPAEVQDALMIILMFVGVVFLSWLPFLMYGYNPLDALFEVVSATGTVGLSCGVTQAALPGFLKLTLCADMLLGRLEFVVWMVFFYHRTWVGRKRGAK